jgi:uncharacterized protein (UPF0335 family)
MNEKTDMTGIDSEVLQIIIDRIERLEAEKAETASVIKDVYAEAKNGGFYSKAIRRVIALRKVERAEREAQEGMVQLYMTALGS